MFKENLIFLFTLNFTTPEGTNKHLILQSLGMLQIKIYI